MQRLIDADELHKALNKQQRWLVKKEGFTNEGYSYDQVHFAIDDAPTVDAVPLENYKSMEQTVNKLTKALADAKPVRHGRWVHLGGDEWYCDKCGFVISTEGSWQHPKAKEAGHDYCMHCGAKMDESTMGQVKPSDEERREDE